MFYTFHEGWYVVQNSFRFLKVKKVIIDTHPKTLKWVNSLKKNVLTECTGRSFKKFYGNSVAKQCVTEISDSCFDLEERFKVRIKIFRQDLLLLNDRKQQFQ